MPRRRRTPRDLNKMYKTMDKIARAMDHVIYGGTPSERIRREQREQRKAQREALRAQREALRWYNSLSDEERQEVDQALEQKRLAIEQEKKELQKGCLVILLVITSPFLLCIPILLSELFTSVGNALLSSGDALPQQTNPTFQNQTTIADYDTFSNPLTEEASVDADEDSAKVISPSTDSNEQDNIGENENENPSITPTETDNHELLAQESIAAISSDDESQNEEIDELPTEDATSKNWAELLAESVDELASWEKKVPAITVPGDAATLADAVEKAQKGDVIQLKKSYNAYNLGVKLGSEVLGIVIDKPIAIIGETDDASDVVIRVGVRESIFVESKSAMFKGVTFQCGPLGFEKTCEPIVSVSGAGSATFKYCSFLGDRVERSVGVQVDGAKAKANFWKCNFQQFGDAGLVAKGKGTATLRYCEFLSQNHYGFSARTNSMVSLERCHFADNEIAFQAETGGGCKIVESRFELNERRAEISATSRNKVRETDNVYDRR